VEKGNVEMKGLAGLPLCWPLKYMEKTGFPSPLADSFNPNITALVDCSLLLAANLVACTIGCDDVAVGLAAILWRIIDVGMSVVAPIRGNYYVGELRFLDFFRL
jgi:hypothetical protein